GPRKPVTRPGAMVKERSSTAAVSPYLFDRFRSSIIDSFQSQRVRPAVVPWLVARVTLPPGAGVALSRKVQPGGAIRGQSGCSRVQPGVRNRGASAAPRSARAED